MEKFIYAFTENARDKLLASGYTIINENNKYYVFENKPEMCFSLEPSEYVFSNILTF